MPDASLECELTLLDQSLMDIKRDAKATYGRSKSSWPAAVHAEIAIRKERAKEIRIQLGLRKST